MAGRSMVGGMQHLRGRSEFLVKAGRRSLSLGGGIAHTQLSVSHCALPLPLHGLPSSQFFWHAPWSLGHWARGHHQYEEAHQCHYHMGLKSRAHEAAAPWLGDTGSVLTQVRGHKALPTGCPVWDHRILPQQLRLSRNINIDKMNARTPSRPKAMLKKLAPSLTQHC